MNKILGVVALTILFGCKAKTPAPVPPPQQICVLVGFQLPNGNLTNIQVTDCTYWTSAGIPCRCDPASSY